MSKKTRFSFFEKGFWAFFRSEIIRKDFPILFMESKFLYYTSNRPGLKERKDDGTELKNKKLKKVVLGFTYLVFGIF